MVIEFFEDRFGFLRLQESKNYTYIHINFVVQNILRVPFSETTVTTSVGHFDLTILTKYILHVIKYLALHLVLWRSVSLYKIKK